MDQSPNSPAATQGKHYSRVWPREMKSVLITPLEVDLHVWSDGYVSLWFKLAIVEQVGCKRKLAF